MCSSEKYLVSTTPPQIQPSGLELGRENLEETLPRAFRGKLLSPCPACMAGQGAAASSGPQTGCRLTRTQEAKGGRLPTTPHPSYSLNPPLGNKLRSQAGGRVKLSELQFPWARHKLTPDVLPEQGCHSAVSRGRVRQGE